MFIATTDIIMVQRGQCNAKCNVLAPLRRMGGLPGKMAGSPKKEMLTNIPEL